jgi:O-antigen ligase
VSAIRGTWDRSAGGAVAPGALLALAAVVGVLAGINPTLGLAAAAGLVFGLLVLWNLTLGLCLFLLVTFLDVVSRNQNLSLTKGAGAVLAGSWLAVILSQRGARRDFSAQQPWLMAALVAFLAWNVMSVLWAQSPAAVFKSTERYALDALLVPIVFWAVRDRRHVVWIFGVFVVGAVLSVLWGLTQGKVSGGAAAAQVGRLSGANVEANVLATLLVVCTVFSSALVLIHRQAPVARTLALLAALGAMAAFFGTFSRGGLISLGVVILVGCVYAGRARPAFVALVVAAVVVGAFFLGNDTSRTVQRLTSTNTRGRADIWKVGLRMVRANPVVGVGSGNYTVVERDYLLTEPGSIQRGDLIVTTPLPAHNIYLHVLAEMGIIGLVLLLSILWLSIRSAVKAVRVFRDTGQRSLEILGRSLVVALIGILAADFFVSDQYSKQLWVLLALGPALLAIARRPGSSSAPSRGRGRRSAAVSPLATPEL